MELARSLAITGESIIRSMEYVFSNQGFEDVQDRFMLGDKYLWLLSYRGNNRKVLFPKGNWKDKDGKIIKGLSIKNYFIPIDELLWFEKM